MTAATALADLQDSPFARKLTAFVRLSDADLTVMSDIYRRRRRFPGTAPRGSTSPPAPG